MSKSLQKSEWPTKRLKNLMIYNLEIKYKTLTRQINIEIMRLLLIQGNILKTPMVLDETINPKKALEEVYAREVAEAQKVVQK